jgi:hypothetical protein
MGTDFILILFFEMKTETESLSGLQGRFEKSTAKAQSAQRSGKDVFFGGEPDSDE